MVSPGGASRQRLGASPAAGAAAGRPRDKPAGSGPRTAPDRCLSPPCRAGGLGWAVRNCSSSRPCGRPWAALRSAAARPAAGRVVVTDESICPAGPSRRPLRRPRAQLRPAAPGGVVRRRCHSGALKADVDRHGVPLALREAAASVRFADRTGRCKHLAGIGGIVLQWWSGLLLRALRLRVRESAPSKVHS